MDGHAMNKFYYSIFGILVAIIFWFFDSALHYTVYGDSEFEFMPTDMNELWMRAMIFLLLVLFGVFADFHTRSIVRRERKLEAQNIYRSTLYATHHILNNLLNQLQLFKLEALRSKDFDKEILSYYESALNEASLLVNKLSEVEDITEKSIKDSIKP